MSEEQETEQVESLHTALCTLDENCTAKTNKPANQPTNTDEKLEKFNTNNSMEKISPSMVTLISDNSQE